MLRSINTPPVWKAGRAVFAPGTTVVMATHDAGIVDQMRKRVIELENGRVMRDQAQGVYGTSN